MTAVSKSFMGSMDDEEEKDDDDERNRRQCAVLDGTSSACPSPNRRAVDWRQRELLANDTIVMLLPFIASCSCNSCNYSVSVLSAMVIFFVLLHHDDDDDET